MSAKVQLKIQACFAKADRVDLREGLMAYQQYHRTMAGIAEATGIPVMQVCGCFAALSPNADYMGNLRSCYTLCLAYTAGLPMDCAVVTTYGQNKRKAWNILHGSHFYSQFAGLKVRNFFRNLSEPDNPEAVTIDGHMANVAIGKPRRMHESGISPTEYRKLSHCFRLAALAEGILPCQLQAVVWFTWKRLHNIVYDAQMSLLSGDNQWRNYVPVEEIRAFPFRMNLEEAV